MNESLLEEQTLLFKEKKQQSSHAFVMHAMSMLGNDLSLYVHVFIVMCVPIWMALGLRLRMCVSQSMRMKA